jgi:hypothetical protein
MKLFNRIHELILVLLIAAIVSGCIGESQYPDFSKSVYVKGENWGYNLMNKKYVIEDSFWLLLKPDHSVWTKYASETKVLLHEFKHEPAPYYWVSVPENILSGSGSYPALNAIVIDNRFGSYSKFRSEYDKYREEGWEWGWFGTFCIVFGENGKSSMHGMGIYNESLNSGQLIRMKWYQ